MLAHHPINTSGPPTRSALNSDDASTPDFKNVGKLLRASESAPHHRYRRSSPARVIQIWWSSKPPDRRFGVSLENQARYLEQALYLLYKQGASVVINLELQDPPRGKPLAAGLLFADGSPKPAFEAWRFLFVTEREGRQLRAWGRAPSAGSLSIERKRSGLAGTRSSRST